MQTQMHMIRLYSVQIRDPNILVATRKHVRNTTVIIEQRAASQLLISSNYL